jgi:hypothetical protein
MGRSAHSFRAAGAIPWIMGVEPPLRRTPIDVLSWFREDELKRCPYCGQCSAVPVDPGPSVCLACQVVWIDEPA